MSSCKIIWLNGAFGVGKTTVARELAERVRRATLFDPEKIGFVLQRSPWTKQPDFQDIQAWRDWTVRLLTMAVNVTGRTQIVPMTLVDPKYFGEVVGRLRIRGLDVRHFALVAPPEVIRARLRSRGRDVAWGEQHLEQCAQALADDSFAVHIDADRAAVSIATEIEKLISNRNRDGRSVSVH